jgi:hypothetical protein
LAESCVDATLHKRSCRVNQSHWLLAPNNSKGPLMTKNPLTLVWMWHLHNLKLQMEIFLRVFFH